MRSSKYLILMGIFAFMAAPAHAESKMSGFLGWFPSHTQWNEFTKFNPYLEKGTNPHTEQFASDSWKPDQWIAQRKGGMELVQGFYRADILRDQSIENDTPVVTVGPSFYRLGGQDKRRVLTSLDQVYGVTAQGGGVMRLRDWHTRLDIGAYTKEGLMLN